MCSTQCGCSSNQKSNKCNDKKYTSASTYDGESFACAILSTIKKNCTSLNALLKLFGDAICTLRTDVDALISNTGFAFAFYFQLGGSYVWTSDADLLTGFQFTADADGFYQVHVTCNTSMNSGAFGDLMLYVNGAPVSTVRYDLNAANAINIQEASLVWRGQVLNTELIEVRVKNLSAFQMTTKAASILINKE